MAKHSSQQSITKRILLSARTPSQSRRISRQPAKKSNTFRLLHHSFSSNQRFQKKSRLVRGEALALNCKSLMQTISISNTWLRYPTLRKNVNGKRESFWRRSLRQSARLVISRLSMTLKVIIVSQVITNHHYSLKSPAVAVWQIESKVVVWWLPLQQKRENWQVRAFTTWKLTSQSMAQLLPLP